MRFALLLFLVFYAFHAEAQARLEILQDSINTENIKWERKGVYKKILIPINIRNTGDEPLTLGYVDEIPYNLYAVSSWEISGKRIAPGRQAKIKVPLSLEKLKGKWRIHLVFKSEDYHTADTLLVTGYHPRLDISGAGLREHYGYLDIPYSGKHRLTTFLHNPHGEAVTVDSLWVKGKTPWRTRYQFLEYCDIVTQFPLRIAAGDSARVELDIHSARMIDRPYILDLLLNYQYENKQPDCAELDYAMRIVPHARIGDGQPIQVGEVGRDSLLRRPVWIHNTGTLPLLVDTSTMICQEMPQPLIPPGDSAEVVLFCDTRYGKRAFSQEHTIFFKGFDVPVSTRLEGWILNGRSPDVLDFEQDSVDLGEVPKGPDIILEFKFTNTSNTPIIIHRASTGDGGSMAEYPKAPLFPGDSGVIRFYQITKSRTGPIRRKIHVKYHVLGGCDSTPYFHQLLDVRMRIVD